MYPIGNSMVSFDNEDQMKKAMSILPQYKFMDQPFKVMSAEARHVMYIQDLSATEPYENVVQLCEEAIGKEGSVLRVKNFVSKHGIYFIQSVVTNYFIFLFVQETEKHVKYTLIMQWPLLSVLRLCMVRHGRVACFMLGKGSL